MMSNRQGAFTGALPCIIATAASLFIILSATANAPLAERWRVRTALHSPVNVVIGRIDGTARFCMQGTMQIGDREMAGVEAFDGDGTRIWRSTADLHDSSSQPGAYLHWIDGSGLETPLVIYSYVPHALEKPGGAILLDGRVGRVLGRISNTTHFGNNNSVVADMDNDGKVDLLYADQRTLTLYTLPACTPKWTCDTGVMFCWSLPALTDLNGDGSHEIVFGSEYNNDDGSSSFIAMDADGRQLWRSDGHLEDLGSTPVFVADVDGDGTSELLKVGLDLEHRRGQAWNHLYVFASDGTLRSTVELGFTGIAMGDMDGDGALDGVGLTNTRDGGNNKRCEIRCVDLRSGVLKWARPVDRAYLDMNSPIMMDLNGDGALEAIVGTGNPAGYARLPQDEPWGDLYVVSATGDIEQRIHLPGWPVNSALCDIDDDGMSELTVVIDGMPGWLALFATGAPARRSDWPTAFGNAARDGTQATVPDP